MSSAAYAALHAADAVNQETSAAAIAARDAIRHGGGDMSAAAYAAMHPAVGATSSTRGNPSSADLNHRAR